MNGSQNEIHILNGESTLFNWSIVYPGYSHFVNLDPLNCGPVPYCDNFSDLVSIRTQYLQMMCDENCLSYFSKIKNNVNLNINELSRFNKIYLWAGIGVEDQIFIMYMVYLIGLFADENVEVYLIRIKIDENKTPVSSLSLLDPETIAKHPKPKLLTKPVLDFYKKAWRAFTAPNPLLLQNFIHQNNKSDKYLIYAMARILQRYPDYKTGLLYLDKLLLSNTHTNFTNAAYVTGRTLGDLFAMKDCVGDYFLFQYLLELGSRKHAKPMVVLSGKYEQMRDTMVCLSDFGRDVLSGKCSSHPTNEIDQWIGGVHISTKNNNVWLYNDGVVYRSD